MNCKPILPLLLALCLCLGLCACGGTEGKPPVTQAPAQQTTGALSTDAPEETTAPAETEAAVAETVTWGDWTIDLPAGFELKGGDFLDENDPRYFSVRKSSFVFFDFKAEGEERIMNNYNYNKNTYTNEQQDVEAVFGGNAWVGFQYGDGFGGFGFEAYTTVDGEMIRVSAAGYAFDDPFVDALLSSLRHTPTGLNGDPVDPEPTQTEPEEPSEGAPVYEKIIKLKDASMGIPAGYTEKKDATPSQYVMENDETGGKVSVWNSSGDPEKAVSDTMGDQSYDLREMDLNGMHWFVAVNEGFYTFATGFDGNVLQITIDYGGTEEEMEDLIFAVLPQDMG